MTLARLETQKKQLNVGLQESCIKIIETLGKINQFSIYQILFILVLVHM